MYKRLNTILVAALSIVGLGGAADMALASVPPSCVGALFESNGGWDVIPTGTDDTECLQYAVNNTRRNGVVRLSPGVYNTGPLTLTKAHVTLRGDTSPTFDSDGYLSGFSSPVSLELNQDLVGFEADFVAVQSDHVTVENVVIDLGANFANFLNSALSAKAEGNDHYVGVSFRNVAIESEMPFDTGIWPRNADVTIENVLIDNGPTAGHYVGINPTGNGRVTIDNAYLTNALFANVCFLGRWELPYASTPSHLTGTITNSKLTDGLIGLVLVARGGLTQPETSATQIIAASGLTIERNVLGIHIQAHADALGESAPTLIDLRISENTYISNYYVDASITFEDFSGVQLIENATVNVKDRDGVFPDPSTVDLGGDELGNRYHLN